MARHVAMASSSYEWAGSPAVRCSILAGLSLLIWWRPLLSSLALATHDERYTHILLILPLSVALMIIEWKAPESAVESHSTVGLMLLIIALVTTFTARSPLLRLPADQELSLNMLALVGWWMGTFIVSFGMRAFRRALFPLCFLLWMVPFPGFVLRPLVRLLQEGSVASAHVLFGMFGIPVVREGTLITIPQLTIEVAPECSSIRSSLMLVITTIFVAQISLSSAWRKAAVIAIAIPLSVVKNGLRIFVLAMLSTRVDRSFLTGKLHHQGGIIYLLIALAVMFLVIWFARRNEDRWPPAPALAH